MPLPGVRRGCHLQKVPSALSALVFPSIKFGGGGAVAEMWERKRELGRMREGEKDRV